MATTTEQAAPPFDWQRWPEAEAFLDRMLALAVAGNRFAADLDGRIERETSTRLFDWVDHLVLGDRPGLTDELERLGYERAAVPYGVGEPAYRHPGAQFPAPGREGGCGRRSSSWR